MTKSEALEFLELPESASDIEIKNKLAEKLAYFELLSEKSPSAFLRRVHGQNVAKVKLLQKESAHWPSYVEAAPVIIEEPPVEKTEEEKPFAQPAIVESIQQENIVAEHEEPETPEILEASPIVSLATPEPVNETESETIIETNPGESEAIPVEEEIVAAPEEKQDIKIDEPVPVAVKKKGFSFDVSDEQPATAAEQDNRKANKTAKKVVAVKEDKKKPAAKKTTGKEQTKNKLKQFKDEIVKSVLKKKDTAVKPQKTEEPPVKEETNVNAQPQPPDHFEPVMQEPMQQPEPQPGIITPPTPEIFNTTVLPPDIDLSKTQARTKPVVGPAAWLVRHTENQSSKNFPLYPGKNYIGRKQQAGFKPFIEVDEDPFVSRIHAALFVEGTGPFDFFINDSSSSNGGKASKNGTYINGSDDRVIAKIKLNDRDTIQIGVTKFVLRISEDDVDKIVQEVEESNYMHTVVIDLRS